MQNYKNCPVKKLGEVLEYEQPTKYIVYSSNYSGRHPIPVLTAGKSFILGYTNEESGVFPQEKLPVIIFDDFTTAIKFVDFPFKVKSSAMKILHARGSVDIKFLFYKMQTIKFNAVQHKRYWISEYSKIEIPVPGIEEQRRIVKKLEKVLTKIDQACTLRQESAKNTENIFTSFINQLLENKKWSNKKMEDLCVKVTDGTHDTPKYHSSGIPLITSKNLLPNGLSFQNIQFISKEDHNQIIKRSHAEKGDVLFAMIGTIGNAIIIEDSKEFSIKNVGLFKTGGNFILGKLLRYLLNSRLVMNRLISGSQGANQKFVSLGQLRNLEVPYTENRKEQEKIVAELDGLSEKVQALQKLQQEQLQDLEALQQSVLHQAFQGEL